MRFFSVAVRIWSVQFKHICSLYKRGMEHACHTNRFGRTMAANYCATKPAVMPPSEHTKTTLQSRRRGVVICNVISHTYSCYSYSLARASILTAQILQHCPSSFGCQPGSPSSIKRYNPPGDDGPDAGVELFDAIFNFDAYHMIFSLLKHNILQRHSGH